MKDEVYKIDFPKLAIKLLPIPLRKPCIIALVTVLVWIFTNLRDKIISFRQSTMLRLKYTGQVCRMEYCLNNILNTDAIGKIRVEDSQQIAAPPFYLYPRGTAGSIEMPVHFGSTAKHIILNRASINADKRVDFYIYIPNDLAVDRERLKVLVNSMKVPGKTWTAINY